MAIKVLSDLRKKQTEDMNPKTLFPEISEFKFYPEIKFCTQCGIKLNVLKTKKRTVITYFPRIENAIIIEFILTAKPTSKIRALQYLIDSI